MKGSRIRMLGNAGLLMGSIVFSLAAIEAGMRLIDGVSLAQYPNFVAKQLDLVQDSGAANRYDPLLGWSLRVGYVSGSPSLTIGDYGVRMNSGMITPIQKGAILATGDSFTLGSEVDDHESWPAHLERLLNQSIVNAGSGGYGVDQIVLRTEDLAQKLAPKTIIVVILSQDIVRNAFDIFGGGGKPYFTAKSGKLIHHNNPVARIAAKPKDIGILQSTLGYSYALHKAMLKTDLDNWWIDNNRRNRRILPNSAAIETSCLLLERVARLRTAATPQVIVGFVYGGGEVSIPEIPPFVPPVVECARKANLEVVDLWDDLVKLSLAELKQLYVIHEKEINIWGHMSSEGNAFVARAICKRIVGCPKENSEGRGIQSK